MTAFGPIAIVSEACILPGASTPAALWNVVRNSRVVTRPVTLAELGVSSGQARRFASGRVDDPATDHDGLAHLNGIDTDALDPVHRWPLLAAWQAWSSAPGAAKTAPARRGVFLANLCYPSRAKVEYAGDVWRSGITPRPVTDTLNSGMPARLIARMIGAEGPALALDAACASSLYALEIACRKLAAGQIDIALVGAVNAADNLILQIGFDALKALSPTGRSRPFIQGADGLVPSEGAAAVVLKRLSDVIKSDQVRGVIRGIGLSNDGKRKGFLAPDAEGQAEAMQRAYAMAHIEPASIGFLECHATGTPIGDTVEIQSAVSVFGAERELAIGSLKANTGHLITVAGLASLLKLTAAMSEETLPPTPLDGALIKPLDAAGLKPLAEVRPWTRHGDEPRRAAISNFGFGGNNSHLILEAHETTRGYVNGHAAYAPPAGDEIVIVGIGLMAGPDRGERSVIRRLINSPAMPARLAETVGADPARARIPPTDLLRAEAQQLAILDVSQMALDGVTRPAPERCGVFAGLRCTDASARWPIRERLKASLIAAGRNDIDAELDAIAPPLVASDVLGAMANMAANRITSSEDFRGQGFAVAAEESSGLAALDLAAAALAAHTLDLAVVTAAAWSGDVVSDADSADRACALVLKRRHDADAAGEPILGTLGSINWSVQPGEEPNTLVNSVYGAAPAASGLFDLALALSLSARSHELQTGAATVRLGGPPQRIAVSSGGSGTAQAVHVTIQPAAPRVTPDMLRPTPYLFHAAATSWPELASRLRTNEPGGTGAFRAAVLGQTPADLAQKCALAAEALNRHDAPALAGVWFGDGAPDGELAFAFTGSAASYPRMGRGLLMAFPEISEALAAIPRAQAMTPLLAKASLSEFEQLCAVSLVTQAHAILMRDVLALTPQAAIGLSLGECNALFAFGFWKDMGGLLDDIEAAAMYERHLGGTFETAGEAWGPNVPSDWTNWRVRAPLARVREEMLAAPNVEITIIYTDDDLMIGGPAGPCRALCLRLGPGAGTLMQQHLVVHANAMKPFADKWRELHTRPVSRASPVRLYANAINGAYTPTKARVADMLTRQAVATVDFPATIRQAWADGVRTFVELGPRDTLTQSIGHILADKPHLAVATDRVETSELAQVAELAAILFAHGYPVRIDRIAARLDEARNNPWQHAAPHKVSRPAHLPLPVLRGTGQRLPVAPILQPPVYARQAPEAAISTRTPFPPPPGAKPTKSAPPQGVLSGRTPLAIRSPAGQSWSREAVEASARGNMSAFFGEAFRAQDQYTRQVRLPAAPLLLVDRITGIDAAAGVEGAGVIWTETDIAGDCWYTQSGRVRPGPLIECGQADLTLIGWMGADFKNQSERVYRLLGCEITFHEGGLPFAGDTLKFQIEITQHATFAGVRMFFFQYDCTAAGRPAFSVRQGQAGFFTDGELASGKGVVWDAATSPPPTLDIAPIDASRASAKRAFNEADVRALRNGDAFACFGKGFELCAAQSFPAHLPAGKLSFFESVSAFDPEAGPWKRGYLRANARVATDAWFYDGHFHNDPCMPGTLMAEAAVQALEFYAAALGLTQERDGYIFEPVPGETARFVCRGQVIPDRDHDITYEVFIDEVIAGETPRIFASLLARSDGRKVFYCPRFGIQLRRNWPAPRIAALPLRVGPERESRGDQAALLDCASGPPSAAFGAMYERFDIGGRVPRLPQPPYHVMSRVTDVSTRPGVQQIGARIAAEYDIPPGAWYFADNRSGAMPFAVLNEIILQPCGWLASHCGFALEGGDRFRNLEGDGKIHRMIGPEDGTICVGTTLSSFSKVGPMTIVAFDVVARLASGEPVMDLTTRFGFFPAAALVRQAGLPITEMDRSYLSLPGAAKDISPADSRLAAGQLRMLDRADYFDPTGGTAGLGLIRGRQAVDPSAWYFKAHFFNDPVQPGSLGLDALEQLLMRAVLLKVPAAELKGMVAETPAVGERVKWSYRGQVTPEKREVTTVIELLSIEKSASRILAVARGSLWCDGLRIYEANPISIAFLKPD